jgi:tetratricopeptide (TPR) repeat protein
MGIAAIAATIGYMREQDIGQQEMAVARIKRSAACMTMYDPGALIRFQKLFQSADQQDEQEQITDAMSLYKKALNAIPQISNALLRLSRAYAKLGSHDDAMAAYKTSIALNPSNPNSILLFGINIQETEQIPSTIDAYKTALHYDPCFAPTYIRLAKVSFDQKNYNYA